MNVCSCIGQLLEHMLWNDCTLWLITGSNSLARKERREKRELF
jgi:hypothetical protein